MNVVPALGVQADRFFNRLERFVEVAQSCEAVPPQKVSLNVVRLKLQHRVCPGHGVFGTAGGQQVKAGGELQVRVVRQQIRGAHVLIECVLRIAGLGVGLGQPFPSLAEQPVDLNRVAVLDDGFGELILGRVLIAALEGTAVCAEPGPRCTRTGRLWPDKGL